MRAHTILLVILTIYLGGCASQGRYQQHQDSAPQFGYEQPDMADATPRYEPYRPVNSSPYTVLGKHYTPLLSGKGYVEHGSASWYGQKFHGHLTSNGETYDMFAMTAAHKTLPLPSYVKVTNLDNGRTAIVRVNDRGPFHDNRIIDLSYAAAKKLDTLKHGVGKVKLEVIHVSEDGMYTVGNGPEQTFLEYAGLTPPPVKNKSESNTEPQEASWLIQVAALSDKGRVNELSSGLQTLYQVPAQTPLVDELFRLQLGPFKDKFQVQQLLDDLHNNGFPSAYILGE
jgi:rare lipoprotein A